LPITTQSIEDWVSVLDHPLERRVDIVHTRQAAQAGSPPTHAGHRPLQLCVVGGGFTGVAGAIALLNTLEEPFRLSIVEPKSEIGRGVAFGGHHPLNLLNVRARDLSISASQPGDFLNWAFSQLDQGEQHVGLHEGLAHSFLPRQLFGEYVRQRFFQAVSRRKDVELGIIDAAATGCIADNGAFRILCTGRQPISADIVFLATAYGLQRESETGALSAFVPVPSGRLVAAKSLALIGSGLTMVDALLSARRNGFQGTATIISPRGQLPRPHAPMGVGSHEVTLPPSKRVSLLAARIRIACETSEAHGTSWQAVINGLRPSLQTLWQELSTDEQARFLRHLRPFWDSHRHRLPMEIHMQLQSELVSGRTTLLKGRVREVRREGRGFGLRLTSGGREQTIETDLAFDCSGHRPDLDLPLVRSLLREKLVRRDPHGLGLVARADGQVIGDSGYPTPGLYALGPLCQGSLWEITAVPEIVRQAAKAAEAVASRMAPRRAVG
jgi:uncharacterized NAD(P)/FAD-binding protein YdhS